MRLRCRMGEWVFAGREVCQVIFGTVCAFEPGAAGGEQTEGEKRLDV